MVFCSSSRIYNVYWSSNANILTLLRPWIAVNRLSGHYVRFDRSGARTRNKSDVTIWEPISYRGWFERRCEYFTNCDFMKVINSADLNVFGGTNVQRLVVYLYLNSINNFQKRLTFLLTEDVLLQSRRRSTKLMTRRTRLDWTQLPAALSVMNVDTFLW